MFTLRGDLVMSLDNPSQRLEMIVPLSGLGTISLVQGIEIARAMWFAFNAPAVDKDIGPYITSAAECTRYRIDRSSRGIMEYSTNRKKQKVFSLEVGIPTYQFLESIRSAENSVQFEAPAGLYKNKGVILTATINTSKVKPRKQSLLAKLAEMAIRSVATPAAVFPQRTKTLDSGSKEASKEPSVRAEDNPTAAYVRSSRQTSSEDSLASELG